MKNNKLKIFLFIILLGILFIPKITITSAEEARGDSTTRTITIKGAGKDHTFKAYQIFKGDLHTEDGKDVLSNIKWGDSVNGENLLSALKASEDSVIEVVADNGSPGTSKKVKDIFQSSTTARDVAEILALYENDSDMLRIFAELASSNLKTNGDTPVTSTATYKDDSSEYTIQVPADGYYLIKDESSSLSAKNEFYTRYILKVANNVSVNVKGEVPTVEKSVISTDKGIDDTDLNHNNDSVNDLKVLSAETGEALEFTLTGTLPTNYKDYKTYKYIFHDTLSKGLTLKEDSIKVYEVIGTERTEIKLCSSSEDHTNCYSSEHITKEDDGTTTLKITIDDLKKVISDEDFDKGNNKEDSKEPKIVVKYFASLNKDAVVGENGNTNTVYLEYSNNPNKEGSGKTGNTPDEKVTIYTYQLNINKQDGKKSKALEGVGFKLYKKIQTDGENEKKVYAVMEESSGVNSTNPYVIKKWTDQENEATEMKTDNEGHISIKGLEDGTYYLKESTTPKGYNTIEDVTITISEELKGNESQATEQSLESLSLTVSWKDNEKDKTGETKTGDPNKGIVETTILNMPGSILPFTGGMGTLLFYIIGFVLVITSFIIIGIKYKKLNKEKSNK